MPKHEVQQLGQNHPKPPLPQWSAGSHCVWIRWCVWSFRPSSPLRLPDLKCLLLLLIHLLGYRVGSIPDRHADHHQSQWHAPYTTPASHPPCFKTCYGSKCCLRERERELRREGGKSLLAYEYGSGPLPNTDRPTTIRSPEHLGGWGNYPPAYVKCCLNYRKSTPLHNMIHAIGPITPCS